MRLLFLLLISGSLFAQRKVSDYIRSSESINGRAAYLSTPFVTVGAAVQAEDTVCLVEVMKMLNTVKAEVAGTIERILVEKRSGKVSYAVLSFGGFWGIGDDYYPLPWEKLTYDESLDGYRIDLTKEQVEAAPKYRDGSDEWYRNNGRSVYDYYGVPPYWI